MLWLGFVMENVMFGRQFKIRKLYRAEIAHFFGFAIEDITINVMMLGGAFGRKSKSDFVVEAVALSEKIKAPVQVVWTREDDIQHSFYHAQNAQYLKGSLDKKGKVTGWLASCGISFNYFKL